MDGPVPELTDRAVACAERLRAADEVVLASHIDADGLTSAAIASTALRRADLPFEVVFYDQLDEEGIQEIAASDYETALFTDFGSGQLAEIVAHAEGSFTPIIADHHQPAAIDDPWPTADGDSVQPPEGGYHLNPLLFGIDGASELSGAGAAYVLARALEADDDNRDLAQLAVVGAVGDMQATGGELVGPNAAIAAEGEAAGVLSTGTGLALYGKQTRPLPKLLEYASEVRIPGITNDETGTVRFLDDLDLDLRADGEWRRWVDLADAERQAVVGGLIRRAVDRGVPARKVERLVGTTYTLTEEELGTALRDASEFSTLLNATARYERADVGLAVCLGDRDGALDRARTLLSNHRRNLSTGLQRVKSQGVTHEEHVQWFDAGEEIRPTIVGIVAGMELGTDGIERDRPILAFAADGDDLKVSARGTGALVRRGLDLSAVMAEASRAVGGDGGGHDVAAGATIPGDRKEAFVAEADAIVGEQL